MLYHFDYLSWRLFNVFLLLKVGRVGENERTKEQDYLRSSVQHPQDTSPGHRSLVSDPLTDWFSVGFGLGRLLVYSLEPFLRRESTRKSTLVSEYNEELTSETLWHSVFWVASKRTRGLSICDSLFVNDKIRRFKTQLNNKSLSIDYIFFSLSCK